jgi:3-hydroxy-9,10-secoandrosta-1,3,5(10)-triene-9,17-dione monooxygenase reductase component
MTAETLDPNFPIIGKIPSGLFIVGVASANSKEAFLASWVQQVSLLPIRLSVVMEADRPAFQLAESAGHLTVNVLGESNSAQMKPFWGGLKSGQAPLDVVAHRIGEGESLLIDGVLGYAHCEIEAVHAIGNHRMVIGRVLHHQLWKTEDKPKVHIRNKGISY